MSSLAIILGIDDYPFAPLSSGVKDAQDVRNALLIHRIFTTDEIVLLTGEGLPDSAGPATRAEILDRLGPLYYGAECERFLFYFSGHGISLRVGLGAGALNAVILCHGVRTVPDDGDKMIILDELVERFRMRGPREQFWVIDACRDIPEEQKAPIVSAIAWGERDPISERRRAVMYAVAPLVRASAAMNGNGRFTGQLLNGLAGKGRAAEWEEESEAWVVTAGSLCAYARARLTTDSQEEWERDRLPRLELISSTPPHPIRVLSEAETPRDREVSLSVDPEEALPAVGAVITRQKVIKGRWPPHGGTVRLQPDYYGFRASLNDRVTWDQVDPSRGTIDTREDATVRVKVRRRESPPAPSIAYVDWHPDEIEKAPDRTGAGGLKTGPPSLERVPAQQAPSERGRKTAKPRLCVDVHDSAASVFVRRLDQSKAEQKIDANEWTTLAPGIWHIEVRLGEEVLGVADEELTSRARVYLRTLANVPPALRRAEWDSTTRITPSVRAPSILVSESMGDIQGGVLPSVLPLLAFRPFDRHQDVLRKLKTPGLRLCLDDELGNSPIGLALALDGAWPVARRRELVLGARLRLPAREGSGIAPAWESAQYLAVFSAPLQLPQTPLTSMDAAPSANLVQLVVPGWGGLEFAVPILPGRVACVGVAIRPDGSYELSLASLANADRVDGTSSSRSGAARAIAIGARLLSQGSDLAKSGPALRAAAYGKWVDPVLGALAWHGYEQKRARASGHSRVVQEQAEVARNTLAAFPGLLDAHIALERTMSQEPRVEMPGVGRIVVGALRHAIASRLLDGRTRVRSPRSELAFLKSALEQLPRKAARLPLDEGARWFANAYLGQPVLAPSLDALAALALSARQFTHWAVARRARVEPKSIWNVVRIKDTR